jgi:hypothetical protein
VEPLPGVVDISGQVAIGVEMDSAGGAFPAVVGSYDILALLNRTPPALFNFNED